MHMYRYDDDEYDEYDECDEHDEYGDGDDADDDYDDDDAAADDADGYHYEHIDVDLAFTFTCIAIISAVGQVCQRQQSALQAHPGSAQRLGGGSSKKQGPQCRPRIVSRGLLKMTTKNRPPPSKQPQRKTGPPPSPESEKQPQGP